MTQETNLGLSSYTYMSFIQWLIYKDAQGNELHCQAAEQLRNKQLSLLFVFQKRLSIKQKQSSLYHYGICLFCL